ARTRDVDAPRDAESMRAALVAPESSESQAELLRAFALPIALLQDADALERVTRELVEAKAADGVRYVEIRWGPLLHLERGLRPADVLAAVCDGAASGAASAATAGGPIVVRLISTAIRSHDPAANAALAVTAARFRDRGLVGWDLAGMEERFPDPLLHAASFEAASAGGLRLTCHAGEWGGAAQVRRALILRPERIAHGPLAIDDPALCAELRDRGIALDLCPTSNVQAGVVRTVADHPLGRLHRLGVPVTLSTDDLTVADIALSEEYARARAEIGLSAAELWAVDRFALDVAFAEEAALSPLRAELDAWAADHRELVGG
ncbi:MAG TPA: adenosine deaminase family protein, partial [Candidatus Acidoferrum sp.]|nr:adenosine deaminase family protein [Candidatus Acidoferrum sp.]